jgi:hypothetical protein
MKGNEDLIDEFYEDVGNFFGLIGRDLRERSPRNFGKHMIKIFPPTKDNIPSRSSILGQRAAKND